MRQRPQEEADEQPEPTDDGLTSFKDIAREMGITQANAWVIYDRALRKLRARPARLRNLVELSELKARKEIF